MEVFTYDGRIVVDYINPNGHGYYFRDVHHQSTSVQWKEVKEFLEHTDYHYDSVTFVSPTT